MLTKCLAVTDEEGLQHVNLEMEAKITASLGSDRYKYFHRNITEETKVVYFLNLHESSFAIIGIPRCRAPLQCPITDMI